MRELFQTVESLFQNDSLVSYCADLSILFLLESVKECFDFLQRLVREEKTTLSFKILGYYAMVLLKE